MVLCVRQPPREIITQMYYVYVLRGPKQFYIGSTNDLRRRLAEHEAGESSATKNRGPWKLIYYEASASKTDGLIRERYLKTAWGKRYLKLRVKNGV